MLIILNYNMFIKRNILREINKKRKDYILLTNAPRPNHAVKSFLERLGMEKEIRDHVDNTDLIIDEMGDVLWYLTRLCDVYDIKISELMINNIDKLMSRMSPEEAEAYRNDN